MHYRLEARDLLREFRTFFDEPWGSTMLWWFTIADELYWREGYTPPHWEYRPSPIGPVNDPDDYATQVCVETGADALVFAGNVLYRYAKLLKANDMDY
jgi:hypothetical protein